jgi:hypothetical protein
MFRWLDARARPSNTTSVGADANGKPHESGHRGELLFSMAQIVSLA